MLYETLSQPLLLIIFIICGIISGFIFDIGNFIKFLCSSKKFPCFVIDIIETFFSLTILFLSNLKFNYGLIRIFPLIIFILAFTIERLTIGKLVAKIYLSCYNFIIKLNKRIWSKFKNGKTNKTN